MGAANEPAGGPRKLRFFRGAATAGLIKIAGLGISFLFLLVVARALSAEGFGVFASAFSLAMILGPVASFGQQNAVLRFWPALDQSHGRLMATAAIRRSLGLALFGSAIVLIAGATMSSLGVEISAFAYSEGVWLATASLAAVFAISEVTLAALRARGSVVWAFAPRDVVWRILVMAIVGFASLPFGPVSALWITTGVLAVLVLAQFVLLLSTTVGLLSWRAPAVLPDEERAEMRASLWGFWGNAILTQVQQQGTTVLVGVVLGPAEAGAYFAASRLANLLSITQLAANQIAAPMMSRAWRARRVDEVRQILGTTVLLSAPAALLGGLVFLALGPWMLALFNPLYVAAFPALMVLVLAQVVSTTCGPNGLLLLMSGHEGKILAIKTLTTVASLALTYTLAGELLVLGAAIGAALGISAQNIVGVIVCKKYTGIAPALGLKQIRAVLRQGRGARTRGQTETKAAEGPIAGTVRDEGTDEMAPTLKPVFVFGYPRSGTTLLGSMLGTSDKCLVVPEAQFLVEGLVRFGRSPRPTREMLDYVMGHYRFRIWQFTPAAPWIAALPVSMTYPDLLDRLFRHYAEEKPGLEYVVEHDPQKRKYLDLLHQIYPHALLLHIVRDGRAIAASTLKLTWGHQDIIRLATEWKRSVESCAHWLAEHQGRVRSRSIRYEDLLVDSEGLIASVFAELGLPFDREKGVRTDGLRVVSYTRDQHALIGGGVEKSRAEAWKRDLTPRQIEIFESLAGDTLSRFGYERQFDAPRPPTGLEKLRLFLIGAVRRAWNKPRQILRRHRHSRRHT